MKYILIICDGCADNPLQSLGGKTPLEYASIPAVDAMAAAGVMGSVRNVPEGFPPGSDTAIMSIFGCAPDKYYSGRAPLEAAAQGIALAPGSAAYRCNNVALSDADNFGERVIVSHSAGGISGEEGRALVEYLFAHPEFKALADKYGMSIHPTDSYRHIAVQIGYDIAGIRLSPPHDHLGEFVKDNLPSGCPAADVLSELTAKSVEILNDHPINKARRADGKLAANAVWFWAEGTAAALPNFEEQYGHNGAVVSAVPLCHGIARLTGLDIVLVPTANGEWDTDYEAKVAAALDALKTHDFAAVHLEGPDEASHNGDLKAKVQAIEWMSSRCAAPLAEALRASGEDFRMLILSDHKTLMDGGAHDGDPVPYLIYDSRKDTGLGLPFSESAAAGGKFLNAGTDLMPELFEL